MLKSRDDLGDGINYDPQGTKFHYDSFDWDFFAGEGIPSDFSQIGRIASAGLKERTRAEILNEAWHLQSLAKYC